jgi:hypothetical protein
MLEVALLKFVFEVVKAAVIEWVPCEESGTAQAGTIPPVNAEVPVLGNVQSGVAPS